MSDAKDRETTAAIIKRTKDGGYGLENVVLDFALYYQRTVPNFCRKLFLKKCGFEGLE